MDVFHYFRIPSNNNELKTQNFNLKRFLHSEAPHQRVKMSCELARTKRKSNLVKMLIMLVGLVVVFQLCYIPRGILMIMAEFGDFSEPSFHVHSYDRVSSTDFNTRLRQLRVGRMDPDVCEKKKGRS